MPRAPDITPRKHPRQDRSQETARTILVAAERVLLSEGVEAFNTNRIAEVAGVSVGSLYQYFPNKAAILFRLHVLEASDTFEAVARELAETATTPANRLRAAIRVFFETEAAEAPLREALDRAAVLYRASSDFASVDARGVAMVRGFLDEALPDRGRDLDHDAAFVYGVVTSVAEHATRRVSRAAEVLRWADDCSDMLIRYLGLG